MKGLCLRLKSMDGGQSTAASFNARQLLFLVSSPGGIRLASEVSNGEIVYVIFSLSGRRVLATAINQAAAIDGLAKSGNVLSGTSISVGLKKYAVEWPPMRQRRLGRSAVGLAISGAVLGSVAFFAMGPKKNGVRDIPPAGVSVHEPVAADNQPVEAGLSEARAHLRAGDISQARLSLIAARENAPNDERVQKLMLELSEVREPAGAKTDAREDEADTLFREGQALAAAGDRLAAKKSFDRAREIIGNGPSPPPFAGALEDALNKNAALLEIELKPGLIRIGESISEAKQADHVMAIKILKKVADELSKITSAIPEDVDAASLKADFDKTVKMTASRWITSAKTAERLSGCSRAVLMYEAISNEIGELDEAASREAKGLALDCRRSPK